VLFGTFGVSVGSFAISVVSALRWLFADTRAVVQSCGRLLVVHRIRDAGPAELSVHIFGVRGHRMLVVLVCSCCSYVCSGLGQGYPVVLRVYLLVERPYSWAAALAHSRYTTPLRATPPTHPPQIPYVLVSVGAGQGVFFVLAGGGVRICYRRSWQRGDWWRHLVVLIVDG